MERNYNLKGSENEKTFLGRETSQDFRVLGI
jgi:hypothetical protein